METITIETTQRNQMIEVTALVQRAVEAQGVKQGVVNIFVPHTTAAVTINENADPSVLQDLMSGLNRMVPYRSPEYTHMEGNSDAHIKSSLVGTSVMVIVNYGRLVLGTWQGIFFCEFDGPRSRKMLVQVMKTY